MTLLTLEQSRLQRPTRCGEVGTSSCETQVAVTLKEPYRKMYMERIEVLLPTSASLLAM